MPAFDDETFKFLFYRIGSENVHQYYCIVLDFTRTLKEGRSLYLSCES